MIKFFLKSIKSRFFLKDSFARNVGVLVGGTVAAQVISIMALPLITRLYTPDDFSVLAVYSSIIAMGSVIACLRLDIAIPVPQSDEESANLLVVSLLSATIFSLLAAAIIWFFKVRIVSIIGESSLHSFLWMIPIGIWVSSIYSAFQFWATRKQQFLLIAKTRINQVSSGVATQISFGLLGSHGSFGLILGQLFISGAGVLRLGYSFFISDLNLLKNFNKVSALRIVRKYDRFPKYSVLEGLTNSAAIEIPVLIIAAVTLSSDVGYLFLAMKVMAIPIGLVGNAVGQVFLSRASIEFRGGNLASFTLNSIDGLMKIGVGPLIFAAIVAPVVFPFVFGNQWQRAGEMVSWMTPWFIFQLIVSPVSMSLHVTENQRIAMWLQIFGFIFRVGFTWIAAIYASNYVFEIYSASGLIFYVIYLFVVIKSTGVQWRDFLILIYSRLPIFFVWIIFALIIYSIFNILILI